ncbi:MAG: TonB-dependent receptor [Nitrospira defluvii]|nr:TonB-dependent receptor [Nitrospira defluvii]
MFMMRTIDLNKIEIERKMEMKMQQKRTPWRTTVVVAALMAGACFLATLPAWAAEDKTEEKRTEETRSEPPPSDKGVQVADVVITGTWTPHAQKDSPVEIERITGKMLEQAGATNVRQVLQDVPAIESRRSGGGFQNFQIQGLSSIHTLFLVNGQELIGSIEGATFTRDLLASPEIESIEIVKGAAAVQYGSDAIAGVINLRTRKATKPAGALLFGQYGRFNTVTTFAAPEFRSADGKFGGYLSAGVSQSEGFDLVQSDVRTDGDPQFSTKSVSGNFDYKMSNSVTLSLYTHFTDDERKTKQNKTGSIPSIREIKGNNERSQNVLRMDWTPDAVSTLTLWGHHQVFQSDSRTFRLDTGVQTALSKRTQELWEPQFQYTRQIGQQLLTFGGEHDIRRARGQTVKGASTDQTESAGWIQDEISVLPWIDVVLGGRYTSNSEAGGFFSPQTTLLLKPGNFRGRFTYTRGFRSPDFGELAFNFIEAGGIGIIGNPNLSPEKSTSYTSNIEYYFERAKIGASVFRHEVSDLIQFVGGTCSSAEASGIGVPLSNCFKTSNVANTRSQGFELEAGAKPFDWLYLETGYMYLDSRDLNTGSFLFTRSPHSLKARVRVEYDGWDFTARVRYFSSFGFSDLNGNARVDPNEKAPSNIQVDVRLSRMLKNGIEIYGGAENLTESRMNVRSGSIPIAGEHLWFVGMRMTL